MKHQKRNSERLMDGMSHLGNQNISDCMLREVPAASEKPYAFASYRRVVAVAAACMAVVMVLGAMVALPLINARPSLPEDEGSVPAVGTQQPSTPPAGSGLSYHNAPAAVKLQSLASSKTLTEEGTLDVSYEQVTFDTAYLNNLFFRENMLLSFDIDEGESITVTSQCRGINPMTYPEGYPAEADYATRQAWLEANCSQFSWAKEKCVDSHTLTSSDAFLMWNSTEKVAMAEDVLTFVIRNAEDQITGAGSILMVKYHPVEYTSSFFYDKASLVRWSVLGWVTFDNPAEVTDDALNEVLAHMSEGTEQARAELSFEPASVQENYIAALADMANTCYDVAQSRQMGYVDFYTATDCSYFKVNIDGYREGIQRQFLLYADGTWQELSPDSYWVLTDHLTGTKTFFYANFADGTSRYMDEERAIYDAEDAMYYGYHFWANNVVYMEKDKSQFELSLDNIMHFMFVENNLSGPFSYYATPYAEDHDFREVFFTVEDQEYHFIVFSGGSWGLVYEDSGYADPETLTGRKIVFWTGLVFELEWQDVFKAGVEEPVHMLAPTYLDEVVVITGQIFDPKAS